MLDKIKEFPEKAAFAIGLTLLLVSGSLLFLLSLLFHIGNWATWIVGGIIGFIAFLFIASATDKRHSGLDKK
ncbi:hypothetical protein RGU12_01770 [Fredinandcohnia sp. QZ13]|uniref:hypothetical protein n=1 Tax=Fredinandcohnia sp. QZ13 TaxID=3073144 RepID=UPI0028530919|nr:hypothetical protein [Fredinandcohnia sp. QZ13]MDR4886273.1 hypothetical protein [Fredinandcohnia sp. QZ13]